jgi:hypothetical protein
MATTDSPTIPVGTKIRLLNMPDDPCPIPAGTEGTIVGGNDFQIWVDWDINRRLMLIIGIDEYEIIL